MIRSIKLGRNVFLGTKNVRPHKRLFLTEAYRCQEEWDRRFDSPILQKVKPTDMFFSLDANFNNKGKASAVDIDIFANTIKEAFQIDELLDLLHRLRLSVETSNTLVSTHHAVIRFLLQHDRINELMEVLDDRLNYGIFPDYFCYNILMDTFIKKKDFVSAARIAGLLMLQEDAGHQISNALSIYSCHKYLENPVDWKPPEIKKDEGEYEEEVKVRVNYLRNPYFDDHFDLVDPLQIVGKTLAFQGKYMDNSLGRTCQLRGMILHRKYDKALKLVDTWLTNINQEIVHEEVLNLIAQDKSHIPEDQITEDFKNLQTQLDKLKSSDLNKENLLERLEKEVNAAVECHAETDILEQKKSFVEWERTRQIVLKEQQALIDKEMRLAKIQQIKEELKRKEQLLTFFENEEKIDLEIEKKQTLIKQEDEKLAKEPKKLKALAKLIQQEVYVPPQV